MSKKNRKLTLVQELILFSIAFPAALIAVSTPFLMGIGGALALKKGVFAPAEAKFK